MGLEQWKTRPYKVRSLVSNFIYTKKDRNGPLSANQAVSTAELRCGLFAPFGCTYPPLPILPFLLKQNLSPKDFAGSDITKLKVS